jgi:DnaJ-domain-containing protein 1
MPDDIAEELAEARHLIEAARGTLKGLDEETLRDAAEWLEQMAVEMARIEGEVERQAVLVERG